MGRKGKRRVSNPVEHPAAKMRCCRLWTTRKQEMAVERQLQLASQSEECVAAEKQEISTSAMQRMKSNNALDLAQGIQDLNRIAVTLRADEFFEIGDVPVLLEALHRSALFVLKEVSEAIGRDRSFTCEKLWSRRIRDLRKESKNEKMEHAIQTAIHSEDMWCIQNDLAIEKEKFAALQEATTKELESEKEKNLCQICMENPRDSVILPCLHFLSCGKCLDASRLSNESCPFCRCKITRVFHLKV